MLMVLKYYVNVKSLSLMTGNCFNHNTMKKKEDNFWENESYLGELLKKPNKQLYI